MEVLSCLLENDTTDTIRLEFAVPVLKIISMIINNDEKKSVVVKKLSAKEKAVLKLLQG